MEMKVTMATRKAQVELTMLEIQLKEQLLSTCKRLLDASISTDEVNLVLPLNINNNT